MKLHQIINMVMDNIFKKYFTWFEDQASKSETFLVYQTIAINQKPTVVVFIFYQFEGVHWNVQKYLTSCTKNEKIPFYCYFIKIIRESGTSFQTKELKSGIKYLP